MSWAPVTPHTFAALDDLGVASNLNTWVTIPISNLNTGVGSLTSYTPTLTAATTNPTGSFTTTGQYVLNGNVCTAWIRMDVTGAYTAGSGIYSMSLPLTSAITGYFIGPMRASAGGNTVFGAALLTTTTAVRFDYPATLTTSATVSNSLPGAWALNASIVATVSYPVA